MALFRVTVLGVTDLVLLRLVSCVPSPHARYPRLDRRLAGVASSLPFIVFARPDARARCNRSNANEGRAAAVDAEARNGDVCETRASALAMLVDWRSVMTAAQYDIATRLRLKNTSQVGMHMLKGGSMFCYLLVTSRPGRSASMCLSPPLPMCTNVYCY
jgi:hypothetical protein